MNMNEIETFIEEMDAVGDTWTPDQVKDVYGEYSLEEALADRKSSLGMLFDVLGKIVNRY